MINCRVSYSFTVVSVIVFSVGTHLEAITCELCSMTSTCSNKRKVHVLPRGHKRIAVSCLQIE